ncbi:hypothetical protein AHAS_Ahas15G0336100 [Arachis hypogaea]
MSLVASALCDLQLRSHILFLAVLDLLFPHCLEKYTYNLVENLLDFEYELKKPYLLYRNAAQEVNGIWFYNEDECEEVANLFNRILSEYSKIPPNAVIPSLKRTLLPMSSFSSEIGVQFETNLNICTQFWKSYIKRPMILVGPSLGSAVAIDFVVIYPEAVENLVLIDASVYRGNRKPSNLT